MNTIYCAAATATRRAPMEHRWGSRLPVGFPVVIESQGRRVATGRVSNASISGALISTDADLPVLAAVDVSIEATIAKRTHVLRLAACVVRREPGAIAVEWRDMATPSLVEALQETNADARLLARDGTFR